MEIKSGRGAAFLDRDGVINVDTNFAHRSDDIIWIDGVFAAIRKLNDLGFFVFVVTNQSGIARGLYTEQHVHELHTWMASQLNAQGARIDDFAYCPHHPEAEVAAYRQVCACRKPLPGMLQTLIQKWSIEPTRSFMIGDRETDIQAANAANVPGYLFTGGSLDDFVKEILKKLSL